MFVHYEDAMSDPNGTINAIARFLNKDLTSTETQMLSEHLSFESMKANPATNMKDVPAYKQEISEFLRKGQVGDWKSHMSQEQSDYIDKMYEERIRSLRLEMKFL